MKATQLGHYVVALIVATYDWSLPNAAYCVGMHVLPNMDALAKRVGWDKKLIRISVKFETIIRGRRGSADLEKETKDPFWASPAGFHCTVMHSLFFVVLVSSLVAMVSLRYALLGFAALLMHLIADIGSTVGMPLLWPFSHKKYTLALFKDTGWWGMKMLIGYYRQPMAWILEGLVLLFFIYRLQVIF